LFGLGESSEYALQPLSGCPAVGEHFFFKRIFVVVGVVDDQTFSSAFAQA
jgi:hypothetical protein